MTRKITVGAAPMGPIARIETRDQVVDRLIALLDEGAQRGCDLIVFPELTLTTFFARWFLTDEMEIDEWFEAEMPGPETQRLFDRARELHDFGGERSGDDLGRRYSAYVQL